MSKYPRLRNIWCANEWVGAPWACGEARYIMPVENYEHDVANSYGVIRENYVCATGVDKLLNNCGDIKWGDGKNANKKKNECKSSYMYDTSSNKYRPCDTHNGKCRMKTTESCNDDSSSSPTPSTPVPSTPVPGGTSGTASTTFYGTQANGEADDPYLNKGIDSSCGCNTTESGASVLSDWYNAAVNDTLFGINTSTTADESKWNCGSGCGRCFELTTTGKRADNDSWTPKPDENQTIKVVVTNMCPNYYNKWCPLPGETSDYGYEYHFDLQNSFPDGSGSWAGCNGTSCNAEVQFQEIECPDSVKTALKENCKGTSPAGWAVAKEGCKYS